MSDPHISSRAEHSILVEGVSKTYGDFTALNQISFKIQPGEIVGFLGPNGAGKTTTMKILTCFMAASEGRAAVAGFDVHTQSKQVRNRVGYLPENVPLYDEMIVYDYLNFIAEMRGVPHSERRKNLDEAVARTGLASVIHRDIGELSKGYRQRVGLAQAIIHRPNVLILDEPTTGLDPNQIIEIRDVIKDLGRQNTIIFSTHILQEVTAVCDRIIIINRGEIVADGAIAELEKAVAKTQPGWQVEFDAVDADADALERALAELPGVDAVERTSGGPEVCAFHLKTTRQDEVRAHLLKAEVEHAYGLSSMTRREPTLEDIFRVYTDGSTEENRDDTHSQPAV